MHFLKIILRNYCWVWDHRQQSNCSILNTTAATFYTFTINTLFNLTGTPAISSIYLSVTDLIVLREVLSTPWGLQVTVNRHCSLLLRLQSNRNTSGTGRFKRVSYCVFFFTAVDKELAKVWGSHLTETNLNQSSCQQDCSHLSLQIFPGARGTVQGDAATGTQAQLHKF